MARSDVTCGFTTLEERLHQRQVTLTCCPDETIVADLPPRPEIPVFTADQITVFLWTDLAGLRRALDLLAMLIDTGDKQHLLTFKALKTGQCITGDGCVGAAEMGLGIDVVERGCEAVGHRCGALLLPLALGLDLNDPLSRVLILRLCRLVAELQLNIVSAVPVQKTEGP